MTQPAPSLRSSSRDWNTCSGSRQTGAPARAAALAAARAQTGCEAPQHRPPGAHPFVVGEAVEATEKLRQAHGVSLGQSPKSQLKKTPHQQKEARIFDRKTNISSCASFRPILFLKRQFFCLFLIFRRSRDQVEILSSVCTGKVRNRSTEGFCREEVSNYLSWRLRR